MTAPTTVARSGAAAPTVSGDPRLASILQEGWAGYRQAFIGTDGRVSDPTRGGVPTSEAQSWLFVAVTVASAAYLVYAAFQTFTVPLRAEAWRSHWGSPGWLQRRR